ncbi:hypothetical protein K438DRAFT_1966807 [Mycena galopus ATCC 62051]|nr:hypothetical protein K438DRAFT_1966807 [Mycena galopus ATCC 62051]
MATHHIVTILPPAWGHIVSYIQIAIQMLQRDPTLVITILGHKFRMAPRTIFSLGYLPQGALIAAYVQSYYCYRLWKLSGKWYYVAPLITVIVLSLVSAIITASVIARSGHSSNWALLELICSRIGGVTLKLQATNSAVLVLLDITPIIYANCMLYILNTRRSLRSGGTSAGLGNSDTGNHHTITVGRAGGVGKWQQSRGQVELSTLGGVQIHTQIETENASYNEFESKRSPGAL